MRLLIDANLHESRAGAVSILKRIEREIGGELAGYLGLVDVETLPVDVALVAGTEYVGLQAVPEREITRDEARDVIESLVECDLAYHAKRHFRAAGASVASSFLGLFAGEDARFFTNGDLGLEHAAGRSGAWSPLTRATFDTGVVAVSGALCGVFWVEDED